MKCLVVYAYEFGFGNVDCEFANFPPKMDDIRQVEQEIGVKYHLGKKPVILNWMEISDD